MRPALVRGFAAGLIVGSLSVAVAATAKADPDTAAIVYAERYGGAVCATLDDYPTFDGIIGVGQAIVEDGLSYRQAGYVVAMSVTDVCPRHLSLVQAFAREYGKAGHIA